MHIEKVLAVYNTSPVLLVVEAEGGAVLELSLQELQAAGSPLSDAVCLKMPGVHVACCEPPRGA